MGYGWCGGTSRWGTRLKMDALDGLELDAEKHYVGIAADELDRLEKLKAPKCSPLAEAGMTEADCLEYCYQRGFSGRKTASGCMTSWIVSPAGAARIRIGKS